MARSTNGRNSFALGKVVTIRSSRAFINEVARLRSIDIRCSVVRPNFLCAFWCRMTLLEISTQLSDNSHFGRNDWLLFLFRFKICSISGVASAGTGNGIALFVKLHTEIQTHAVENLFDFV